MSEHELTLFKFSFNNSASEERLCCTESTRLYPYAVWSHKDSKWVLMVFSNCFH